MDYYTEDLSALPYDVLRDTFRMNDVAGGFAAFLAWYIRLWRKLGFKSKPMSAYPANEGDVIDRAEVSRSAKAKWSPVEEELDDLEFTNVAYLKSATIGPGERFMGFFLASDQLTVASLMWIDTIGAPQAGVVTLEFNSYGRDGHDVLTSRTGAVEARISSIFDMDFVSVQCHRRKESVASVYAAHQERIKGKPLREMLPESVERIHDERGKLRLEWALDKGLVRKLTDSEVKKLRVLSESP